MKVLMLHGYTQSGPQFKVKVRPLEQRLSEEFPGVLCYYPTGPLRLDPGDRTHSSKRTKIVPIAEDEHVLTSNSSGAAADDIDMFAWVDHHDTTWPPRGTQESLEVIADICLSQGPFDGIIAFSQGTVIAALVAAILDDPVRAATVYNSAQLRLPVAFTDRNCLPLKFVLFYGPAIAPRAESLPLYTPVPPRTRFCHVVGACDPVVDLDVTAHVLRTFVGPDGTAEVLEHPGGHFPPMHASYVSRVLDFVRSASIRLDTRTRNGAGPNPSPAPVAMMRNPRLIATKRRRRANMTRLSTIPMRPFNVEFNSVRMVNACLHCNHFCDSSRGTSQTSDSEDTSDGPVFLNWGSYSSIASGASSPDSKASGDLIDVDAPMSTPDSHSYIDLMDLNDDMDRLHLAAYPTIHIESSRT